VDAGHSVLVIEHNLDVINAPIGSLTVGRATDGPGRRGRSHTRLREILAQTGGKV